jgi:hypothetical protein
MHVARGVVVSAQEGRFMLASSDGRMRLMMLAPDAGWEAQDLPGLVARRSSVTVTYQLADGRMAGIVRRLRED